MTRKERNNKLKHLITCMKCEVSGKCCDENCPTQYEAGNMGEIIEGLEEISKILEQGSSEDCVSREQALLALTGKNLSSKNTEELISLFNKRIKALPPVAPIHKVGKWIAERDDYGNITGWHCSNCYNKTGFVTTCAWDYCPNCGAEMESDT